MRPNPYKTVATQQSMALDLVRNRVYLAALKKVITSNSVVLDLGAGLGTLGLLSAQLGAKTVYMVEPEPIIKLIPKIAEDNGLAGRVACLQGKIEEVSLPEKVDVIISVFTGNFLLSENLLPSLFYARDKYLKPGGVLLPDAGEMWLVPISATEKYKKRADIFERPHLGLNVSSLRQHATNSVGKARFVDRSHYLCKPQPVKRLDFTESSRANCHETLRFTMSQAAICHGFVGWFDMFFGRKKLTTAPHAKRVHWSPLLFLSERPIKLSNGQELKIKVDKSEKVAWTWRFESNGETQQQTEIKTWLNKPRFIEPKNKE